MKEDIANKLVWVAPLVEKVEVKGGPGSGSEAQGGAGS